MDSIASHARIDTRLIVLDWHPDEALWRRIVDLTTFEIANDPPALLTGEAEAHLAWHGYLTGGLTALFNHLGDEISAHGLTAFYANQRLEVFVPPTGDVVALGALRHPLEVPREEWNLRCRTATDDAQLLHGLMWHRTSEADEVIAEARAAVADLTATSSYAFERPEQFEVTPPGVIDWGWLEDAEFRLIQDYDPEGSLTDASLECRLLRLMTTIFAPWSQASESESADDILYWRVHQYEWDEDDDGYEDWLIRAETRTAPNEFANHLPAALVDWVVERAQAALESFAELEQSVGEDFANHKERASQELRALRKET